MRPQFTRSLAAALCLAALVGCVAAPATTRAVAAPAVADAVEFPTVDPGYIYDQLAYMAEHFQRREAGYDNNLPVSVNGHDEFAAYWQAEMLRDLQGFGAQAQRDLFPIVGWQGRPATGNAFNVEVTVPGVTHAEQVVVIGCHYDGEASSTQSANDDASGCAIELGVAQALATYWRAHHLYPARTLRFVIYDAEEQGLYGSFHYLNQTINGDIPNVVAMINEEQNGIGYPLRFLGQMRYPTLPTTLLVTPLTINRVYGGTQNFTSAQVQAITSFRALMGRAAPAAFDAFRALGYDSLSYLDAQNHPVSQPIFTQQDLQYTPVQDDTIASSDQYPFSLAGVPTATFIGNYSYYELRPPVWSYPYDQPQDTIQLMNIYASGGSAEAKSLELALALPGMLTTWTLSQPSALGFASADGKPLAAIGDIGTTQPGQPVSLDATAYDPAQPGAALSYHWSFGDGAQAQGISTTHTWAREGDYTLTLTVSDANGARTISKTVRVTTSPQVIDNPYTARLSNGVPRPNPAVTLPGEQQYVAGGANGPNDGGSRHYAVDPVYGGGQYVRMLGWLWSAIVFGAILALGVIFSMALARKREALARAEAEADRLRREQTPRSSHSHLPDERLPDRSE